MATTSATRSPRVGYVDMRGYLDALEEEGLLRHVQVEVDPKYEIGAVCARSLDRHGPGLLFDSIQGYPGMSFAANLISTIEQTAIAFRSAPEAASIMEIIETGKNRPVQPEVISSAACQEVVITGDAVDVNAFPTPWWHELDGGQYIATTAGVITANPDNGFLNLGLYRAMIKDRKTLTVGIKGSHPLGEQHDLTRVRGAHIHILENEAHGLPTPIAIAIGMDPLLTFVAGQAVPSDDLPQAEYAIAGAWRGLPTELVRCVTTELLVPAWSEIILEGFVQPNVRAAEGPHGESQGFYNGLEHAFVIELTAITHRRNPIAYGLVCRQREDYPKFLFSAELGNKLVGHDYITDVFIPDFSGGGLGLIAIVATSASTPNEIAHVTNVVRNAPAESLRYPPRWIIIVDEDCDIRNWDEVMWRVAIGVMPDKDVQISARDTYSTHHPMAEVHDFKTSTIVVDATFRSKSTVHNGEVRGFPPVNKFSRELMDRVDARWSSYGLH